MPTESQWEYACRARTSGPFNIGDNITTDQANYNGSSPYNNNPAGENRERTIPVGTFAANAWGLHDMHRNVNEWCQDWYASFTNDAQTDPIGAASGDYPVVRGGSWENGGRMVRSVTRHTDYYPSQRNSKLGFRLVRPAQ